MQPDSVRPVATIPNNTFSDGIFTSNRKPCVRGVDIPFHPRRFNAVSSKAAEIPSDYTPVLHCGMAAVSFLPLTAHANGFTPISGRTSQVIGSAETKNAGNAGVLIGV